tara:strand:+ start:1225 stop:2115 length:891 start_codon:yes stop_codon:yes gene_type:complete
MATNTIAGANLAAIAEETLPHLTTCFAALAGVHTDLSDNISSAGESVTTRVPTKAAAIDLSSGYTSQNTALTAKTVTLNTFYGQVVGFKDAERSKSVVDLSDQFIPVIIDSLGDKVFGDIWNLVLNANFSTNTVITAANFDRDDVVDLGASLTSTLKAPKEGRTIWSNPTYYGSLLKTLNSAEMPGVSENKAEGTVPRSNKFDIYETDLADANSENLAAFAFHRSSILFAARGVDTAGDASQAAGVEIENVTVPGLEIPVQFRRWYDPNAGELKISVGLLYGVAVGNDMGHRVLTA